jgi:hypothetical protein
MKLKGYKFFEKEEVTLKGYSSDDDDDHLFGRPNYSYNPKKIHSGYNPDEEDEAISADMDHFLYLLRAHFRNCGISDIEINREGLDITIFAILNKREKLKSIINIFNAVKKIKKDLMQQYDSDFELYESKLGDPVLSFEFTYDEGGDSKAPF